MKDMAFACDKNTMPDEGNVDGILEVDKTAFEYWKNSWSETELGLQCQNMTVTSTCY